MSFYEILMGHVTKHAQDGSDSSIPSAVDELLYQLAPPTWRTGPRLQRIGGDAEGAGWEGVSHLWVVLEGMSKVDLSRKRR